MKITIPRYKGKVKGVLQNVLYAIVCQFDDGSFDFADFWDLPYTGTKYAKVCEMKKVIQKWAKKYGWISDRIKVVKIEL